MLLAGHHFQRLEFRHFREITTSSLERTKQTSTHPALPAVPAPLIWMEIRRYSIRKMRVNSLYHQSCHHYMGLRLV